MADKLPKGVTSIGEAARARGKGGGILKERRVRFKGGTLAKRGLRNVRKWRHVNPDNYRKAGSALLRQTEALSLISKSMRNRIAKKIPVIGAVIGAKDLYSRVKGKNGK